MIKLENVVLASSEQMEFIIEGMRNPMNSWEKSDTETDPDLYSLKNMMIGSNDHSLMQRLAKAGTDHRKFMRMMPVTRIGSLPCNQLRIWKSLNPLTEFSPFIQLMIFARFIDICQHFIIHHDISGLVIAARKELDHLPPVILRFRLEILLAPIIQKINSQTNMPITINANLFWFRIYRSVVIKLQMLTTKILNCKLFLLNFVHRTTRICNCPDLVRIELFPPI